MAGSKLHPGAVEITSPMLVGIAVAVIISNLINTIIQGYSTAELGTDTFTMPEAFQSI